MNRNNLSNNKYPDFSYFIQGRFCNNLSKTEIVKVQQNKTKKWYDDYSKIDPEYNCQNNQSK